VDIGANRGQFALVARRCFPQATIFSFEPLSKPVNRFRRVFAGDERTRLYEIAVSPRSGKATIHVSAHDDSSSLLPITTLQDQLFPGTSEVGQETVRIGPLREFVRPQEIDPPALLKIDVQGYELETLKGCESLLDRFAHIYVECSFVELYAGQASASEVIDFLHERGFVLKGIYNITYDRTGLSVQADFFFGRSVG
jgi:FkbM family methyltransferase